MTSYRKLGRVSSHRNAMLKNMTLSLLKNGKIQTTQTRALEMRRMAEKMITLAKRGDLHARRQVVSFIGDKEEAKRLFEETAPKYKDEKPISFNISSCSASVLGTYFPISYHLSFYYFYSCSSKNFSYSSAVNNSSLSETSFTFINHAP